MEYTAGKGTTALGIIGTALGSVALVGGNLINGAAARTMPNCNDGSGCSENHFVNRYEAALQARNAELETEVKLRDSTIYTDQKSLEMYKYFDGKIKDIYDELSAQRVHNQRTQDSFALAQSDLAATKAELKSDIKMEAERRCCADNSIVTYANATFYPKEVANVTVGTTTTAQTLYNPIPKCNECCA